MKLRITVLCALLSTGLIVRAQADPAIASVQQKLKDQGFYYGEVSGQKDADTTAAIRRYQIRNGLKITGDLDAETQKSLGVKGAAPAAPAPPRPAATPAPQNTRDEPAPTPANLRHDQFQTRPPVAYAPGPRGLAPETSGIFDGTPYEVAPPELQRRVVIGAQTLLARRGYYRGAIDGSFGPAMNFAVRAFQQRFDIAASGHLDMDTLGALGLLPGQQAPGVTAPSRRASPRRLVAPNGERIYDPR